MIAAELVKVEKRFGTTEALRDVSFAVSEGEVVALLGPNGAGKSTALAVLLGLRRPDRGEARLAGGDPRRAATRRAVGVVAQESAFPGTLRVDELVALVGRHYPRPLPIPEVLERFGLADLERRQLGGSPEASAGGWPSRSRSQAIRRSSCSTSRRPRSTPRRDMQSGTRSARTRGVGARSC